MFRKPTMLMAALALMLVAVPAHAGNWMIGLNGGLAAPMFSFKDKAKLGFLGGVGLDYFVTDNVAVGIDGSFIRNSLSDEREATETALAGTPVTAKFTMLQGGAHLKYMLPMASEAAISPFVVVGLGIYRGKDTYESLNPTYSFDGSSTRYGPRAGLGLMYKISETFGIGVEGAFHGLWLDGSWMEFISVQTGVSIGMGNAAQ